MTHDHDFDPDDNFAIHGDADAPELDEEAAQEALVWQWLLRVNPGDEDAALQQFSAWQEALADGAGDDIDPLALLRDVTAWKSSFAIDDRDPGSLVDAVVELAARWNLHLDWGTEDPTDAGFLAASDVDSLVAIAFDRLREHGYTLWTQDTGMDADAGWISRREDDDAMRMLASALAIDLRMGAG